MRGTSISIGHPVWGKRQRSNSRETVSGGRDRNELCSLFVTRSLGYAEHTNRSCARLSVSLPLMPFYFPVQEKLLIAENKA